jgi:hypothetical protein
MWQALNKTERYVLVTTIYQLLLNKGNGLEALIKQNLLNEANRDIDILELKKKQRWSDLVYNLENSIYLDKDADLNRVNGILEVLEENLELYLSKIKEYTQSYQTTPTIVKAILVTLFLELDETMAFYDSSLPQEGLSCNFLGKYPRITQELIAGEYTSLVNAIIHKVSANYKLKFKKSEQFSD